MLNVSSTFDLITLLLPSWFMLSSISLNRTSSTFSTLHYYIINMGYSNLKGRGPVVHVCVCMCVCAHACVCMHACLHVCVCVRVVTIFCPILLLSHFHYFKTPHLLVAFHACHILKWIIYYKKIIFKCHYQTLPFYILNLICLPYFKLKWVCCSK